MIRKDNILASGVEKADSLTVKRDFLVREDSSDRIFLEVLLPKIGNLLDPENLLKATFLNNVNFFIHSEKGSKKTRINGVLKNRYQDMTYERSCTRRKYKSVGRYRR